MVACSASAGSPEQASERSALAPLPAHEAVYEVLRRGSKIGEVHVSLSETNNGVWLFDTETVATARLARVLRVSAEESAHFAWNNGQVLMLTYRQVARAPARTRFWQHEVDWQSGISRTETYEENLHIPAEPGMVDPLTLRLQLAVALNDPANRGTDLHFRVLERDEVEDQHFFYQAHERVEVPAGCFDAIRMQRFRREGSSRNYDSWHAEAFHWLPLRILQTRDGDPELDIRLLSTSIPLSPNGC
ncbi:MAG: DUF3108 domain-containing protein [Wenzhouxiangella sp.]